MLAKILEGAGHLVLDMVAHGFRDAHPFGRRQRLQPRGDIDAFAIDIVALDHHVTEIDADAKPDALAVFQLALGAGHRILDGQRAGHRRDHAGEFRQGAVADELDHPPAMFGHQRIENLRAMALQPLQRPRLVRLGQAAPADHVGIQDCGQFSLHRARVT